MTLDLSLGNGISLEIFISRYERDILVRLLGFALYKEFSEQFDVNVSTGAWVLKTGADVKWKELLNGKEYVVNDELQSWKGLVFVDGVGNLAIHQSLIAYYVYKKFIEATEFNHSGVGMTAEQAKNSIRVGSQAKVAQAHNDFYILSFGNSMYGQNDLNYEGLNSYMIGDGYRSLYEFLEDANNAVPATYKNWKPSYGLKLEDRFGL